jgi:predicted metal-dependent enzyme (double-stranded beta helix superfamily)
MTSTSTLVERLRRAANSGDPMRDIAVVMSEFIDDGGVELVDDPFHPARKDPVDGLIATLASTQALSAILVRSAPGLVPVPQRHELPVAVGVLAGRLVVDVYLEDEGTGTVSNAGGIEVLPEEVYVIEPDVIHNIRFVDDVPGLAVHVIVGDLDTVERSRWIDGHHERLAPSTTYPLTALPMPLAPTIDPEPSELQTSDNDSPPKASSTD